MEAFVKVYLYRKDLFDDPKVQEAFKAKYGRDLAPAKTHEQYREIAEFFTEWGKDNGLELWGTTVQAHSGHPSSWYEFFESWRRPSASTTGASTPTRTTPRRSPMAAR